MTRARAVGMLAFVACTANVDEFDEHDTFSDRRLALAAATPPVDLPPAALPVPPPLVLKQLDVAGPLGTTRTISTNERIDPATEPFFVAIGTNGRACVHCHTPADAWSITPLSLKWRFTHPLDMTDPRCLRDESKCREVAPADHGLDPIFRSNDGAVSPLADTSTPEARRAAYGLLLAKGLIRVGIGIPENAEFELAAVDDPYAFASARELSLFRRPLPSTNLHTAPGRKRDPTLGVPVLTAVMWDGRETTPGGDILADLLHQANGATLGHAQAIRGLTDEERARIVSFEAGLFTAAVDDVVAGDLTKRGANGGPAALSEQIFYVGINDVIAGDFATGAPFSPDVFELYDAWSNDPAPERTAVARGQAVFNRKSFSITGVKGLNDVLGVDSIPGSCSSCHDAPGFGHHSVKLPIDIGLSDGARRTPDLPLYTLRNTTTNETTETTDPGFALVSGKWADIGKLKGPILRALAARPPYFHNGSAESLADVVDFYDGRFAIGLTVQERADLIAFLRSL
jgi:cytochrome c peroxidase